MPAKIIFSSDQLNRLKELVTSGMRQTDIAKHFNVTDDTIRRICREENIEIKMPHKCKCIICGDTFYSNIKGAQTCNKEHHRICKVCGKDFIVDRFDIRETCKGECTNLAKYGVKSTNSLKSVQAKKVATTLERYGAEYLMRLPEYQAKYKQTIVERYGVNNPNKLPEVREKIELTNLERYGCRQPLADPTYRSKIDQINLEKYGTIYPMQTKELQAKQRHTMIDKYGVTNPMYVPEVIDNLRKRNLARRGYEWPSQDPQVKEKMKQTNEARFNVPWACMREEARKRSAISGVNKQFAALLEERNIEYEFEHHIEDKSYDIFVQPNELIEINPTITHNSYMSVYKGVSPMDMYYHKTKTELARRNGYNCINVFDWDNWNKIIDLITPKQRIYARKCSIIKVNQSTANQFTALNHLQGSCNGQVENYALYRDDQLVQIMTFGQPRYNKKYKWELLRLCSRSDLKIVGGASKLFAAFIREHTSESVISYCDLSKFSGDVYIELGMELDHISQPAKIWSKDNKYITDNLLRQRGYDQLFDTDYGKGTSNEDLMIENKWLPVYDCGQAVYTYNK